MRYSLAKFLVGGILFGWAISSSILAHKLNWENLKLKGDQKHSAKYEKELDRWKRYAAHLQCECKTEVESYRDFVNRRGY